jgi:hypothetical protein
MKNKVPAVARGTFKIIRVDGSEEICSPEYPSFDRLVGGPSYIEIGGELGSQDLALRLIGLGALVELWPVITPKIMGLTGKDAQDLAGSGFVMAGGIAA